MKKSNINPFRIFYSFTDLITLNILYFILIILVNPVNPEPGSRNMYMLLFIITNVSWMSVAYFTGVYINNIPLDFERFAKTTSQAFLLNTALVLLFIFISNYSYSRLFILLFFISFAMILIISRMFFLWGLRRFINNEKMTQRVVFIGYNDTSKSLSSYFSTNLKSIAIDGYFEEYSKIQELSVYPIIGHPMDCLSYAIVNEIDEIYCTISPEKNPYIYEMAKEAETNMIRFKFVPDLRSFVNVTTHMDIIGDNLILAMRAEPQDDVASQLKKRIFDVVFSSLVLIFLLSWLIPVLGIIIKLSSKGPVFFVQLRSGKDNEPFKCFKFRSLRMNEQADKIQVTKNDSRLTPIGKFMRKTNLDELPQFINVFLGDMTVVGPRPHMLEHTEKFSKVMNEYMVRHFLKPGITGWAQINGFRGEITQDEHLRKRIEHDIWYMENWSLWLDFRIIFLTVINTVRGEENAY
jgi:putative colanic acid biosysnthesis UDP-glucose lipid carrier transferase